MFLNSLSKNLNKSKLIKQCCVSKCYSTEEVKFETKQYLLHKLDSGPSQTSVLNKKDALHFYQQMNTIRRMENVFANLYTNKEIRGFCHLYAGQEAICVGVKSVMRPKDVVITAYRAHAWAWIMEDDPKKSLIKLVGEMMGKKSGCCRGKGGSMHTYARNFYGGNGIVGAQVPIGTGLGFVQKYKGTGAVSVTLYGDGAGNQGQIFEVFNIAKLWNLPMLYICENNKYGMGTSASRASANPEFYTRCDYIPGIRVDGMDVLAVREATKFALDYILKQDKGPIILEMMTYRYFGHSMSDPGTSYRTRDEIQKVRQSFDPIITLKEKLIQKQMATAEELKKIEDEARRTIDGVIKTVRGHKEIDLNELTADVYSKSVSKIVRNNLPWNPLKHKRIGKPKNK